MDKKETIKYKVQIYSAIAMLFVGSCLSVAGFCVPPVGEISDSVLWFFAQCLVYAGSIFGVSIYIQNKMEDIRSEIKKFLRDATNTENK